MQARIDQEIELLRRHYASLEYNANGQWVLIPQYPLPAGWNQDTTSVAFQIPVTYPGTSPYGIYVPAGLRYQGSLPNNYKEPVEVQLPFSGTWGIFSWSPDDGHWRPTGDLISGSNLLNWARGFSKRFQEGI